MSATASRVSRLEQATADSGLFKPSNGVDARIGILGPDGPELAAGDKRLRMCIALQAAPNVPEFAAELGLPDTSNKTIVARARAEHFTEAEISFLRRCLRKHRENLRVKESVRPQETI